MGCCEHGNEQLELQNEGNLFMNWRNISFLRRTLLHAVSCLLQQQAAYLHPAKCITVLWTATIQSTARSVHCTAHCTLCRYSERLLHCTLFNKNQAAWYFVSLAQSVTWCTVAIIIGVVLLSSYLCIHGVSLSSIQCNKSRCIYKYVNQRHQHIRLIWS